MSRYPWTRRYTNSSPTSYLLQTLENSISPVLTMVRRESTISLPRVCMYSEYSVQTYRGPLVYLCISVHLLTVYLMQTPNGPACVRDVGIVIDIVLTY